MVCLDFSGEQELLKRSLIDRLATCDLSVFDVSTLVSCRLLLREGCLRGFATVFESRSPCVLLELELRLGVAGARLPRRQGGRGGLLGLGGVSVLPEDEVKLPLFDPPAQKDGFVLALSCDTLAEFLEWCIFHDCLIF